MMRTLVFWMLVRAATFGLLTVLVLHDWGMCLALIGAFTLIHAETILEARREERERWGRWRD
jgi:hypothetical protein